MKSQVIREGGEVHTHLRCARDVGKMCKFPIRGNVAGPGGRPGSREPILYIRLVIQRVMLMRVSKNRYDIVRCLHPGLGSGEGQ